MKIIRNLSLSIFLIFNALISPADPGTFNYDHVASNVFWAELYPYGGWTLYCGYKFDSDKKTLSEKYVNIEHIYPINWMFKQANCENRMQCRETNNQLFTRMEADMHNMYPAWQSIINYRYNFLFGHIDGEEWRFDDCDFEWKSGVAEPRPVARGNIARAIFYMHTRYGMPIDTNMLKTLKAWNREDPPSDQEKVRNDKVELLQGQRNPFIDNPSLAEDVNSDS